MRGGRERGQGRAGSAGLDGAQGARAPQPPRRAPRAWGAPRQPDARGLGRPPVSPRRRARLAWRRRLVASSGLEARGQSARGAAAVPGERRPWTAGGSGGPGGGLEMSGLCRLLLSYLFPALLLHGEFLRGRRGAGAQSLLPLPAPERGGSRVPRRRRELVCGWSLLSGRVQSSHTDTF